LKNDKSFESNGFICRSFYLHSSKAYTMKIFFTIFFLLLSLLSFTQTKDSSINCKLLLKFQSIGTGVPSDVNLIRSIKSFKKKYHIRQIKAQYIGPMGREGEYYLCFNMKEMNSKNKNYFIKKMKSLCEIKNERGFIVAEENTTIDLKTLSSQTDIRNINY